MQERIMALAQVFRNYAIHHVFARPKAIEKWFGKFRQRIKRNFRALGVAFEAHANWSIYVEEEVVRCQAATS